LYQHFTSKAELIDTVINDKLAEISCIENAVYQKNHLVLSEQLRQLFLLYLQILYPFHKMVLKDLRRCYPNQWKTADEFRQKKWQKIVGLLHNDISKGQIRPVHPAIFKIIIHTSLQELLYNPPLPEETNSFDAIKELIDILLTGIIKRAPTESCRQFS
jgi:AcrR family transcriptional regulator